MSERVARRQARLAALMQKRPSGRGQRFARRSAGEIPACLGDLTELPDWTLLPSDKQARVARIAGLMLHRAAIDSELSGARLSALASALDEDVFDAACAAEVAPDFSGASELPTAKEVVERGWAALHGSLPDSLGGGKAEAVAVAAEAHRVAQLTS